MMCSGLSVRVYMPGRARTGSKPLRTLMLCSSYFIVALSKEEILQAASARPFFLDLERDQETRHHVVCGDRCGELDDLGRAEAAAHLVEQRSRHAHVARHRDGIA